MRQRAAGLAAALAIVCAGCSAPGDADDAATAPVVPFAPYVNATTAAETDTAGRPAAYHLAFAVASGSNECTPMWDDARPIDDPDVKKRIAALRKRGTDIRVSFGGATGTELAVACDSPAELATAYQEVIDRTGAETADFDIEGDTLKDSAALTRRSQAVRLLQERSGLDVTFTLPVMPTGLIAESEELVRRAVDQGVEISAVNIMTMNYSPSHRGDMGDYAIKAAKATHDRLKELLDLRDADAWQALRVTVMIGVNDIAAETFTLQDAAQVAEFASKKGVDELSMWSAARDRACAGGAKSNADDTCSGVSQNSGDFAAALSGCVPSSRQKARPDRSCGAKE